MVITEIVISSAAAMSVYNGTLFVIAVHPLKHDKNT